MKEIDLTIPFGLSNITLGQYQDYLKILDGWDEEDEVYLQLKILQIFCKMNPDDVQRIRLKDFESTILHITELFKQETPLIRHFTMTGSDGEGGERKVEFGFIPKLDDISFGEYIDLENYLGDWQQMHKAMAVLFRPVYHKKKQFYLIDKYEGSDKYYQVMKDMPLDVALGATVFFYHLGIRLQTYTLDSLQQEMKEVMTQESKQTLEKNGDGINQYTHLLKETLEGLSKLHRPVFINAL